MIFFATFLVIPAVSQDDMAMDMGLEPIGGADTDLFKTMMDISQTMKEEKEEAEAAAEEQAEKQEKVDEVKHKVNIAEKKAAKHKYLLLGAMLAVPLMVVGAVHAGGQIPEDANQRTMRITTACTALAVPAALLMHTAGYTFRKPQEKTLSLDPRENPLVVAGLASITLQQVLGHLYNMKQSGVIEKSIEASTKQHQMSMVGQQYVAKQISDNQQLFANQSKMNHDYACRVQKTFENVLADNQKQMQLQGKADAGQQKIIAENRKEQIKQLEAHMKVALEAKDELFTQIQKADQEKMAIVQSSHAEKERLQAEKQREIDVLRVEKQKVELLKIHLECTVENLKNEQQVRIEQEHTNQAYYNGLFGAVGKVASIVPNVIDAFRGQSQFPGPDMQFPGPDTQFPGPDQQPVNEPQPQPGNEPTIPTMPE